MDLNCIYTGLSRSMKELLLNTILVNEGVRSGALVTFHLSCYDQVNFIMTNFSQVTFMIGDKNCSDDYLKCYIFLSSNQLAQQLYDNIHLSRRDCGLSPTSGNGSSSSASNDSSSGDPTVYQLGLFLGYLQPQLTIKDVANLKYAVGLRTSDDVTIFNQLVDVDLVNLKDISNLLDSASVAVRRHLSRSVVTVAVNLLTKL